MSDTATRSRPGRWFSDRPIGVKIGSALALLGVVSVGLTTLAVDRIETLAGAAETLSSGSIDPLVELGVLQRTFQGDRARYNLYGLSDEATRAGLRSDLAERRELLQQQTQAYLDTLSDPSDFDPVLDLMTSYYAVVDEQLVPAADAGDDATALAVASGPLAQAARSTSDAFGAEQQRQADDAAVDVAEGQALADSARNTLWVALIVGLLLAAGLAVVVVRQLVRTVQAVRASLDAMAEGDLTRTADVRSGDELGQMAGALATAQEKLRSVIASVVSSADTVAASAEELSASSAQISASAEETSVQSSVVSSSAEEVSRSVATVAAGAEEMGASIREISQNAN
ncbi:HAMP domain-containing protein, partial [Modestobacter italicus]|uniref:HAMP domain-containing protein n=1 Tax=Modestobacter italicus (strain DSM 44449 / CECT 9708 / BC 501) TaxID=2732864 RepID=UPI001C9433B5